MFCLLTLEAIEWFGPPHYSHRLGYGSSIVAGWNGLARNLSQAAATSNAPTRNNTDSDGPNGPAACSDTPPPVDPASRWATAAARHSCRDPTSSTSGSEAAGRMANTSSGRPRFWAYSSAHARLAGLCELPSASQLASPQPVRYGLTGYHERTARNLCRARQTR